jgi:hypothetical protein
MVTPMPEVGSAGGAPSPDPSGPATPIATLPMEPPNVAANAPMDWWDVSFSARRKVLIDNSELTETLESFPILVKLDSDVLDQARLQPQGEDLRFVDLETGELLAHEVEAWDPRGESLVWLVMPQIAVPPATPGFVVYHGNAAAAPPPRVSVSTPWSAPFSGVWHLNASMADSSSNAYDGQRMEGGNWIPGPIGDAYEVSVSRQEHIMLKNDIDVVGDATSATLSAWIRPTTIQGKGVIVTFGKAQTEAHASYLDLNAESGALVSHVDPMTDGGGYQTVASPQNQLTAGTWAWAVVVIDLTAKTATFYLDGEQLGPVVESDFNAPQFSNAPSNRSAIGTEEDEAFNHYDGAVDEIRIERVGRSATWIATQYRAMTDVTFLSWQAPELLVPAP